MLLWFLFKEVVVLPNKMPLGESCPSRQSLKTKNKKEEQNCVVETILFILNI